MYEHVTIFSTFVRGACYADGMLQVPGASVFCAKVENDKTTRASKLALFILIKPVSVDLFKLPVCQRCERLSRSRA